MDLSALQTSSRADTEWKYPLAPARSEGHVQVDQDPDHRLYWAEYGNPQGEPVLYLHGGPGGGCTPTLARFFDPERYRVILFDQRGCGRSEPNVARDGVAIALTRNTTDHLVADINRLREALGITGRMHVFGGSWGSMLALVYGIRHPDQVATLVLRGVFIGGRRDLHYLYQGNAATSAGDPTGLTEPGAYVAYPDEWKAFLAPIPPADRGDMMAAYKAIFDQRPVDEAGHEAQRRAAMAWSAWEGAISHLIPPGDDDLGKFGDPVGALCLAQIEAHYFANDLFLEPDYILRHVHRLAHTPIHIVHGRFDQVCPLTQASQLAAALDALGAPPASFVKTLAGHSALEGQTVLALTAIMDGLPAIA